MQKFSVSLLFFWLKGSIEVDERFVKSKIPNTLFGIIPVGSDSNTTPLKNISNVATSFKVAPFPLIVGLLLLFIRMPTGTKFLFLIIALLFIATSIKVAMTIQKSGTDMIVTVPFYEKGTMDRINDQIYQGLAEDTDKTDLNRFFDEKEG
ncbi:MAG TPA: hypothetical protein VK061_02790 [Bacillota bacterium]|nr:hypothetical protein [Bacillota bacterium]